MGSEPLPLQSGAEVGYVCVWLLVAVDCDSSMKRLRVGVVGGQISTIEALGLHILK